MPPPTGSAGPDWEDVTATFATARASMAAGDMIHSERFTLFSAMSAIELMDPKMDVGCGPVRDLGRIVLPAKLSDRQVLNIMDRLLACEATWLEAHTLAQTVFSCVYAHRVATIPSVPLFSFVRVQLATMDLCINLILDEKVAEEEDFVNWTHVFPFPNLAFHSAAEERTSFETILADARAEDPSDPDDPDAAALVEAIAMRLDFRLTLHRAMRRLCDALTALPPPDTDDLLAHAEQVLRDWADCPFRAPVDDELLNHLFDSSINRHHMMATPPRTAPLMSTDAAIAYFSRIVAEIRAALALRDAALRPVPTVQSSQSLQSAATDRAETHPADSSLSPSSSTTTTTTQQHQQSQRSNQPDEAKQMTKQSSTTTALNLVDDDIDNNDVPLSRAHAAPRYSLQVALFTLETFGAMHNPRILTRSVLSRLLIPQRSIALFANPAAMIPAMFRVDMCAVAARDGDAAAAALVAEPFERGRRRWRPARGKSATGMLDTDVDGEGGGESTMEEQRKRCGEEKVAGDQEGDDDEEDDDEALQEVVTGLLDCMLRNRSRLRRQLLRALQWWDRYAILSTRKTLRGSSNTGAAKRAVPEPKGGENGGGDGGEEPVQNGTARASSDKENEEAAQKAGKPTGNADDPDGERTATRREVEDPALRAKLLRREVAHEISCRLMALHWLLGFEVELYQDFEYVAVYFYIGYVLTLLGAPSTEHAPSDARSATPKDPAALVRMVEQVHPARHALARLDDGRRWLSRALSTFLHALSDSPRFSYSCVRGAKHAARGKEGAGAESSESNMFGSDELWFQQRFGAMRGLENGPRYTGHALFKAYVGMHDEALLREAESRDVVLLRLEGGASDLQEARLMLGRAKKMGERFNVPTIAEEAWRLAAVAVQNSVAVARAIAMYKDGRDDRVCKVRFQFSKHKHFAIVELDDA